MPKRIQIQPHLSLEELEARYWNSKDVVEHSHYQIIWLLVQGKTTAEVAEVTGYTEHWVRVIVQRYNAHGPTGLKDRRHDNPGPDSLLNAQQQAQLEEALQGPAPHGGLWNGPKVAQWMSAQLGRFVYPQRGWDYLKRLGYSAQLPRPRHAKAEAEEQEAFKKRSPTR